MISTFLSSTAYSFNVQILKAELLSAGQKLEHDSCVVKSDNVMHVVPHGIRARASHPCYTLEHHLLDLTISRSLLTELGQLLHHIVIEAVKVYRHLSVLESLRQAL